MVSVGIAMAQPPDRVDPTVAKWWDHARAGRHPVTSTSMERPSRFEHTRFLGDKRTQLVYDLDTWTDVAVIDEIVEAGVGLCFGPDTLAEARNRGYTLAEPGMRRRHRLPRA
jgi:hypothetical protein